MAELKAPRTLSYLASEQSRVIGRERDSIPDGEYRVLATLIAGERSYRVFADLVMHSGDAELALHRFDHVTGDEWFVDRKVKLHLPHVELAPMPNLNGASFRLSAPLRLDEVKAAVVFGPSGPPEI